MDQLRKKELHACIEYDAATLLSVICLLAGCVGHHEKVQSQPHLSSPSGENFGEVSAQQRRSGDTSSRGWLENGSQVSSGNLSGSSNPPQDLGHDPPSISRD